jgi:hypothetical protein
MVPHNSTVVQNIKLTLHRFITGMILVVLVHITCPFIGSDPQRPIGGGFPAWHAFSNSIVVFGVKHS